MFSVFFYIPGALAPKFFILSMKVAHSLYNWLPGTMIWVYNQLKYLPDVQSIVLAEQVQNKEVFPWSPVYIPQVLMNPLAYKMLLVARRLGSQWHPKVHHEGVRQHLPAILHSHFGDRGWHDRAFAGKYSLKHVVTFYGYDVSMLPVNRPYWKKRYKQLFESADRFLCEGPFMAQSLAALGCPQEKITVQRLGIETERIPYQRRELGKDNLLKILIAGSFREKKGIPVALEAIAVLYKEYKGIQVTLIGDAGTRKPDQVEKEKILKVIRENHLDSIVDMVGFQPYETLIQEFYRNHIFLSPSVTAADGDTEGGAPVTIIEAAASGMPVVSTTHCDIPYIIKDKEAGFLVPERDVSALVNALRYFIDSRNLIEEMGRNAHEYITMRHSAKKQALTLKDIYNNSIGQADY